MDLSFDRTHTLRALRTLVIGVIVEVALIILADQAPALASLIQPLYWLLGAIFLYSILNALKARSRVDRRRGDRRDGEDDGDTGAPRKESSSGGAAR